MCREVFILWSSLFAVLKTSYIFMGIQFFKLGKFYSINLLKVLTSHLSCKPSLSSYNPECFFFLLLFVSWISWMTLVTHFLHFAFSFTVESMLSMVYLAH